MLWIFIWKLLILLKLIIAKVNIDYLLIRIRQCKRWKFSLKLLNIPLLSILLFIIFINEITTLILKILLIFFVFDKFLIPIIIHPSNSAQFLPTHLLIIIIFFPQSTLYWLITFDKVIQSMDKI